MQTQSHGLLKKKTLLTVSVVLLAIYHEWLDYMSSYDLMNVALKLMSCVSQGSKYSGMVVPILVTAKRIPVQPTAVIP